MSTDGWVVEPREAPAALAEDFQAEPFAMSEPLRAGSDWVSLADKIGAAKMEELYAIFGGHPIDPSI